MTLHSPPTEPRLQGTLQTPSEDPLEDGFHVHLDNFSGPFDLLLSLIAKHKLDITEIALAQVTDEFISYLRLTQDDTATADSYVGGDSSKNLGVASEFLLVAATLLDLKAARLLPQLEDEDEDALELLEARDLLFAKLLQYRAFKELAAVFLEKLETRTKFVPRAVSLEPRFAGALPPLVWKLTPEKLQLLAQSALGILEPKATPVVQLDHLHNPRVSMADEIPFVLDFFARNPRTTFTELISDTSEPLSVVIRFLILLELYRDRVLDFTQTEPLHTLSLCFVGGKDYVPEFSDEYTGTLPDKPRTGDETGSSYIG